MIAIQGVLFRLLVTISANLGTVYIKRGKMLLLSLPMVLILPHLNNMPESIPILLKVGK